MRPQISKPQEHNTLHPAPQHHWRTGSSERGLSVVEALIALGILGVVVVGAVEYIRNTQLASDRAASAGVLESYEMLLRGQLHPSRSAPRQHLNPARYRGSRRRSDVRVRSSSGRAFVCNTNLDLSRESERRSWKCCA